MLCRVSDNEQVEYVEVNIYDDNDTHSISVSADGNEQTVSLELLFAALKSAGYKVSKI